MATVRVEWVRLGRGPGLLETEENIVREIIGSAVSLAVSGTATASGDRPQAPSRAAYARVSATEGNSLVAWGSDPTANQMNSLLIMEGSVELVPVSSGMKLSFVEPA